MTPIEKYDASVGVYLQNLRMKGKSERTLRNYTTRLSLFRAFWTEHCGAEPEKDPDYAIVLSWRDAMLEEGKKASTTKQYMKELSFFFEALRKPIFGEELRYADNPVDDVFYPAVEKRPYDVILNDSEVLQLVSNTCHVPQMKATWARNYAIVAILLTSQIRNSELLDLRLSDLDFANGEINVEHGKGNKFRCVEFTPFAQSAVKLYLTSGLRPAALPDSAPLFGTTASHEYGVFSGGKEKWHKGSSQWLSSLVERHVRSITGVPDVRTHDLRHVGSRLLLNAGASMEFVQAELGHASLATTQIYCGRLMQRRGQNSAKDVFAEMGRQAVLNEALERGIRPAKAV